MARKHCTKHTRSKSRYPERLRKRGLKSASVRMDDLETLRKLQHAVVPNNALNEYLNHVGRENNGD